MFKPLEWVKDWTIFNDEAFVAKTPFGTSYIVSQVAWGETIKYRVFYGLKSHRENFGLFPTLEDGKRKAASDYRKRIKDAIQPLVWEPDDNIEESIAKSPALVFDHYSVRYNAADGRYDVACNFLVFDQSSTMEGGKAIAEQSYYREFGLNHYEEK